MKGVLIEMKLEIMVVVRHEDKTARGRTGNEQESEEVGRGPLHRVARLHHEQVGASHVAEGL